VSNFDIVMQEFNYMLLSPQLKILLGEDYIQTFKANNDLLLTLNELPSDVVLPEYSHYILTHEDDLTDSFFALFEQYSSLLLLDLLPLESTCSSLERLRKLLNKKKQRFWFHQNVITEGQSDQDKSITTEIARSLIASRLGLSYLAVDWLDLCLPSSLFKTVCYHYQFNASVDNPITSLLTNSTKPTGVKGRLVIVSTPNLDVRHEEVEKIIDFYRGELDLDAICVCTFMINPNDLQHWVRIFDYA